MTVSDSPVDYITSSLPPTLLIRSKRIKLLITAEGSDDDIPHWVRQSLVGISVEALYTRDQMLACINPAKTSETEVSLPVGCLIGKLSDIIDALKSANKAEAAAALELVAEGDYGAFYIFEPGTFELLPE